MIFFTASLMYFTYIHTWFLQGLLHPLLTPSHLILVVSLGLLIGQNKQIIKSALLLLISTVMGIILNQNIQPPKNWNFELILLTVALITGLIVVIRFKRLYTLLLGTLVILSGLLLGYDSSPVVIPGVGLNSINNWISGATISILISILVLSSLASLLRPYWDGIILRVIGSWIATSALFTFDVIICKKLGYRLIYVHIQASN